MSNYKLPDRGPGFPRIRWHRGADGRFEAEWLVELVATAPACIPLAIRRTNDVEIHLSFPREHTLLVRLNSRLKPIRPEVYAVFYQLIQPSFDLGFVASIEGGDLSVHEYVIRGTANPVGKGQGD